MRESTKVRAAPVGFSSPNPAVTTVYTSTAFSNTGGLLGFCPDTGIANVDDLTIKSWMGMIS